MTRLFRCGHPRSSDCTSSGRCRLCERIRNICRQHQRDQQRLNDGKPLGSLGKRIARGAVA